MQKKNLDQDIENVCTSVCQSVLNQSNISKEIIIKKELYEWGKTQPEENKGNVEIAKQRILACYKNNECELDLSHLNLTSVPNSVLQKLGNLTSLNLSYNQLSSLDRTGLINLRSLYLNNNQLSLFDGTGLINSPYAKSQKIFLKR